MLWEKIPSVQFVSPPRCIFLFCCWHLHIHCKQSEHLKVLKHIILHQFSCRRARSCRDVRHCSTMCSASVIWAESPNLTESGKCIYTMKWLPTSNSLCQSAVPPLISTHNFMLIRNHKYAGLTWSLQRVQTIGSVSACLLKHFLYHLPCRCEVEP